MSEGEESHQPVVDGPRVPAMDMHVHTNFSDAQITVPQLVDVAERRRYGISVCDHNEIRGSIALWETGRAVTIPAIEIGSRERMEFLLYFDSPEQLEDFYVHQVEPHKRSRFFAVLDRSFTTLVPSAKEYGAIVCLPHPFAPGWKNFNFNKTRKQQLMDPDFLRHIDLVEVINSHIADSRNFKAFMLSEILDKSVSAGSDAHRIMEVGSAYLSFGQNLNFAEIHGLLKSRIKVGSDTRFKYSRTVGTSRGVILNHLKLYFRKKDQARWMIPYESEAYDPAVMPDRRAGGERRRFIERRRER